MTTYLEYLLKITQNEANETYETALQNAFNYYVEEEVEDGDDLVEARKSFEESKYYFLTIDDFFKAKIKTINSIKKDADNELIRSIDTLDIEQLRQSKLVYNKIIEIADAVNQSVENDCVLVY